MIVQGLIAMQSQGQSQGPRPPVSASHPASAAPAHAHAHAHAHSHAHAHPLLQHQLPHQSAHQPQPQPHTYAAVAAPPALDSALYARSREDVLDTKLTLIDITLSMRLASIDAIESRMAARLKLMDARLDAAHARESALSARCLALETACAAHEAHIAEMRGASSSDDLAKITSSALVYMRYMNSGAFDHSYSPTAATIAQGKADDGMLELELDL
jgi:hypothetical protein